MHLTLLGEKYRANDFFLASVTIDFIGKINLFFEIVKVFLLSENKAWYICAPQTKRVWVFLKKFFDIMQQQTG